MAPFMSLPSDDSPPLASSINLFVLTNVLNNHRVYTSIEANTRGNYRYIGNVNVCAEMIRAVEPL